MLQQRQSTVWQCLSLVTEEKENLGASTSRIGRITRTHQIGALKMQIRNKPHHGPSRETREQPCRTPAGLKLACRCPPKVETLDLCLRERCMHALTAAHFCTAHDTYSPAIAYNSDPHDRPYRTSATSFQHCSIPQQSPRHELSALIFILRPGQGESVPCAVLGPNPPPRETISCPACNSPTRGNLRHRTSTHPHAPPPPPYGTSAGCGGMGQLSQASSRLYGCSCGCLPAAHHPHTYRLARPSW